MNIELLGRVDGGDMAFEIYSDDYKEILQVVKNADTVVAIDTAELWVAKKIKLKAMEL